MKPPEAQTTTPEWKIKSGMHLIRTGNATGRACDSISVFYSCVITYVSARSSCENFYMSNKTPVGGKVCVTACIRWWTDLIHTHTFALKLIQQTNFRLQSPAKWNWNICGYPPLWHPPFTDLLHAVLQLVALEKDDEHWLVDLVSLLERNRNVALTYFGMDVISFTCIDMINIHAFYWSRSTWANCHGMSCDLTVAGSSSGSSISAFRRNTLPRHTLHSILSKVGILSLPITPATNLHKNKSAQIW